MTATSIMTCLCACGCGQPTKIASRTNARRGWVKGQPMRFLFGHPTTKGMPGANWKGGRTTLQRGYIGVWAPDHQRAHNGYVREHILVVERALGHPLPPKAEVHHFDENPQNNAPTNLVACDNHAYHKLLHQRMRALVACGDASALPCNICGSYDRQDDMVVGRSHQGGRRGYHRDCRAAAKRRRRAAGGVG